MCTFLVNFAFDKATNGQTDCVSSDDLSLCQHLDKFGTEEFSSSVINIYVGQTNIHRGLVIIVKWIYIYGINIVQFKSVQQAIV